MGCAQDGASTTVMIATDTRVAELGGAELEPAAPYCVVEVPGPAAAVLGLDAGAPGLVVGAAVPDPPEEVPGPTAEVPEPDLAAPGSAGMKMDSDFGEGLIEGLRGHWRDTPAGMACQVEPMRARASAALLLARGT